MYAMQIDRHAATITTMPFTQSKSARSRRQWQTCSGLLARVTKVQVTFELQVSSCHRVFASFVIAPSADCTQQACQATVPLSSIHVPKMWPQSLQFAWEGFQI